MLEEKFCQFLSNERIRNGRNDGREYQILGSGPIKQGGFSAVYKAHANFENVGLVAIKVIFKIFLKFYMINHDVINS